MSFEIKNTGKDDDGIDKLFAAIGRCQQDIPALPKTGKLVVAKGAPAKPYVTLDVIIEGLKPQLKQHGVTFCQLLHSIGNLSALTLVVAGHGASLTTTFEFQRFANPQDAGKQITYYKRYQITAFFGVVGDEDADEDTLEVNRQRYDTPEQEAEKELANAEKRAATIQQIQTRFTQCVAVDALSSYWRGIYKTLDQPTRDAVTPALQARKTQLLNDQENEREPGEEG